MTVRSRLLSALVLTLALPASAEGPATPTPVSTAKAFYTYHLTHDMGFTPGNLEKRTAWLAPGLLAACRTYFAQPKSKDEAPAIEGDPFTDSQEYPKSFKAGTPRISGQSAVVPVTFSGPGAQTRTVQVVLSITKGSWLITNVRYGKGRSLRASLSAGL